LVVPPVLVVPPMAEPPVALVPPTAPVPPAPPVALAVPPAALVPAVAPPTLVLPPLEVAPPTLVLPPLEVAPPVLVLPPLEVAPPALVLPPLPPPPLELVHSKRVRNTTAPNERTLVLIACLNIRCIRGNCNENRPPAQGRNGTERLAPDRTYARVSRMNSGAATYEKYAHRMREWLQHCGPDIVDHRD
jgi:hypothetical protein